MRSADCVQLGMNLGVHGRGFADLSIDVQINLLARRNNNVVARPSEPMKEVDAFVVDAQQLRGDVQPLQRFGFIEVTDMCLDRVHGAAALSI